MIKAILSGSFNMGGVSCMELAKIHSRGVDRDFMSKRAAVLTREIEDLRPEQGRAYIHLIALGDQETYGLNRNGDGFPKSANQNYHHTFVTDAHVYKHHQNKDPRKASGKVVASAYNDSACRVELIIGVDEEKWAPELTKLANGELAPVSMACRVPWDECTVCENRAHNRGEYCDHLKNDITKVAKDGTHIGAINYEPTYFDISSVMRNADRIAFGLNKVASESVVLSGAELAETLGIYGTAYVFEKSGQRRIANKMAALNRLASMEKEIDGALAGKLDHRGIKRLVPAVTNPEPLTAKEAAILHSADPRVVFGALAKEAVCLDIEDFYRVVFGNEYGPVEAHVKEARTQLPGIFSKMAADPAKYVEDGSYEPKSGGMPRSARELVVKIARKLSSKPGPSMTRITVVTMRKASAELVASAPAGSSKEASFLASEYAKYKLAFADSSGAVNNDQILMLTALQNYVK